jgi:hypothetical protein
MRTAFTDLVGADLPIAAFNPVVWPSSPPAAANKGWVCWPRPATGRTSSTPS